MKKFGSKHPIHKAIGVHALDRCTSLLPAAILALDTAFDQTVLRGEMPSFLLIGVRNPARFIPSGVFL